MLAVSCNFQALLIVQMLAFPRHCGCHSAADLLNSKLESLGIGLKWLTMMVHTNFVIRTSYELQKNHQLKQLVIRKTHLARWTSQNGADELRITNHRGGFSFPNWYNPPSSEHREDYPDYWPMTRRWLVVTDAAVHHAEILLRRCILRICTLRKLVDQLSHHPTEHQSTLVGIKNTSHL